MNSENFSKICFYTSILSPFKESAYVMVIFSANNSGCFQGMAYLLSESINDGSVQINWILTDAMKKKLSGNFKLKWLSLNHLPFVKTSHLKNSYNENKLVKIGRDGQV